MTVEEFFDTIDVQLVIRRRPGLDWYVRGENTEVMTQGCLAGTHGNGETPDAALRDYARQIAGERIAVGAYTSNRREFNVPKTLT